MPSMAYVVTITNEHKMRRLTPRNQALHACWDVRLKSQNATVDPHAALAAAINATSRAHTASLAQEPCLFFL
eukprot:1160608-Pelagomonas_calceolata.AAC.4